MLPRAGCRVRRRLPPWCSSLSARLCSSFSKDDDPSPAALGGNLLRTRLERAISGHLRSVRRNKPDPLCPNEAERRRQRIFANNQVNLKYVGVYGFDYDYTLALYNDEALLPLIYNAAKRRLVEEMNYPASLMDLEFDPHFAVRGLHFDSERGTIFKMDHLNGIQGDSVYFGREPLTRARTVEYYGTEGTWRVPRDKMCNMRMLNDQFAIPEANLLSDTIQVCFVC
jgi:hypothetical protein